jgi:hypothetical protein
MHANRGFFDRAIVVAFTILRESAKTATKTAGFTSPMRSKPGLVICQTFKLILYEKRKSATFPPQRRIAPHKNPTHPITHWFAYHDCHQIARNNRLPYVRT